jgi:hypothetical protein
LMLLAIRNLHSQPPNSVIFTDTQGSVVLNYYLCGEGMTLPFTPQTESLLKLRCGDYYVLSPTNTPAGFDRTQFPALLAQAWGAMPEKATLYLFQSGWLDDRESNWLGKLRNLGGNPHSFGPNILVCPIQRTGVANSPTQ